MEKNMKKTLAFGVLGMFVILFAAGLVSAADVVNPIGDWFTKWENANMSLNIAKYLLWALVSMAVFSVGSNIPAFSGMFARDKEWMGAIFSIIVGFLSMAYITPSEVYTIMTSYTALGFVLGGAIPFIILIAFTFTLATDTNGGAGKLLANKTIAWVMWAGFLGFLVYKAFVGLGEPGTLVVPQWVLILITVVMLISLGTIFAKFRKAKKQAERSTVKETMEDITALRKAEKQTVRDMSE